MTEDEAKTKLCCGPPMLFALLGALKDQQPAATTLCQASACMAWRWNHEAEIKTERQDGHCGLAGPTR